MLRKGEEIGRGRERVVRKDLVRPHRAIKENLKAPESPEFMKASGYMGKLLYLLFPEHFPRLYKATFNPAELHMEYIEVKDVGSSSKNTKETWLTELREKALNALGIENWEKISSVIDKELKSTGIEKIHHRLHDLDIHFDGFSGNFEMDKKGRIMYMDTVEPWTRDGLNFSPLKVSEAIQGISEEIDRRKAHNYLTHIIRLHDASSRSDSRIDS